MRYSTADLGAAQDFRPTPWSPSKAPSRGVLGTYRDPRLPGRAYLWDTPSPTGRGWLVCPLGGGTLEEVRR